MMKFISALVLNLFAVVAAFSQTDTTLYVRNPLGNGIVTIRNDAFLYVKGNMKLVETKGTVAKNSKYSFFIMMNENGALSLTGGLKIESDTTILQTRVKGNFNFIGSKAQDVSGSHVNFNNVVVDNSNSVNFSSDSIFSDSVKTFL